MSPSPSTASLVTVTLLAAAATLATAGEARAGTYLGLGLGRTTALHGDMDDAFDAGSGISPRVALGQRIGPVALEASYAGSSFDGVADLGAGASYAGRTLGLDLKLHLDLVLGLGLYGKGGLTRTWLDGPDRIDQDYVGAGWDLGVGVQYEIDLVLASVAVWLDFTRHQYSLHEDARPDLDGGHGVVSLGVTASVF